MQTIEMKDYSTEIDSLEKLISNIQTNVFFTLGTLIAVIALSIALGGWALKVLTKHWVEEKVKKELDIIDDRIMQHIRRNYQLKYYHGYVVDFSLEFPTFPLSDHGLDIPEAKKIGEKEIEINNLKKFSKKGFVSLELIDSDGIIVKQSKTEINDLSIQVTTENTIDKQIKWVLIWIKD